MDILKNSENGSSLSLTKSRPIILIIILIGLLVFAFFFYSKNFSTSFVSNLTTPINTNVTYQSPVSIDFEFLKSDAFNNLESFPDYPQFKGSDGLGIKTGRVNPFIPPTGLVLQGAAPTTPATPAATGTGTETSPQ